MSLPDQSLVDNQLAQVQSPPKGGLFSCLYLQSALRNYWKGNRLACSLDLALETWLGSGNSQQLIIQQRALLRSLGYDLEEEVAHDSELLDPYQEALNLLNRRDNIRLKESWVACVLKYPEWQELLIHYWIKVCHSDPDKGLKLCQLLSRQQLIRADLIHRILHALPFAYVPHENRLVPRVTSNSHYRSLNIEEFYHQCRFDFNSCFYSELYQHYCELHLGIRGMPHSDYLIRVFVLLGLEKSAAHLSATLTSGSPANIPAGSISGYIFQSASLLYKSEDFFLIEELRDRLNSLFVVENWALIKNQKPLMSANNNFKTIHVDEKPVLLIASPDLRNHPVGRFWWPLHNSLMQKFRIVQINSVSRRADYMSDLYKETGIEIAEFKAGMSIEEELTIAASYNPSILIDLVGHTADSMPALSCNRIADLQISYLGYFGPTLAACTDYWMIDTYLSKLIQNEPVCREPTWELPFFSLIYDTVINNVLPLKQIPSKTSQDLRIGSFNHTRKLASDWMDTAANCMSQDPSITLVVKSHSFIDLDLRRFFLQNCDKHGIPLNRLITLPFAETTEDSFRDYRRINCHLDSHPICGTTTTFDSLMHGVPVLSRPAGTYASSISAAILQAYGLEELVINSHDPNKLRGSLSKAKVLGANPRKFASGIRDKAEKKLLEAQAIFPNELEKMLRSRRI